LKPVRDADLVPPQQRDSHVPGALVAICLKAMAARPEDRYVTAGALAEDLTRWLADEPASAFREGLSDRLGRWARRHRARVQAAAVALVIVAGLATTAAVVVDRARRGEQKALVQVIGALAAERAAKAEADTNLTLARQAVDEYFTRISDNALLLRQDAAAVRDLRTLRKELLEVALAYYNRLAARRASDPALRRDQADAFMRVGRINQEIGSQEAALAAYQQARAIWTELAERQPADAPLALELALSHLAVADMLGETGRAAEALAEFAQGQVILQRLADADPSGSEIHSELARGHNGQGLALRTLGRPDQALAELDQARAIIQRLAEAHSADALDLSRLATSHGNIGMLLNELGRPSQAVAALEQCRSIYQRLVAAQPTASRFQDDLAGCENNLGLVLAGAGRPTEALTALKRGREILQGLVQAHPSVTEYRRDLATNYMNTGNVLSGTGQPAEALAEFERARAIIQPLADTDFSDVDNRRNLAAALYNIGDSLRTLGRIAEAREPAEQACTVLEAISDRDPFGEFVLASAHALCADLIDHGSGTPPASNPDRGEDHARRAVEALRRAIAGGYRTVDLKSFAALQSRPDFQDLMWDLALPDGPFEGEASPSDTRG
jgi:tetratricopeptide (TPR) repeat protein